MLPNKRHNNARERTDCQPQKRNLSFFMKPPSHQPKSISELIDTLDRIREELLVIQKSLERVERDAAVNDGEPSGPDGA